MVEEARIIKILEDAIDKKLGQLFVDRDTHHRDHLIMKDLDSSLLEFMKTFHKLMVDAKSVGISTIITVVIPGIFVLVLGGIVLWLKTPLKNLFH